MGATADTQTLSIIQKGKQEVTIYRTLDIPQSHYDVKQYFHLRLMYEKLYKEVKPTQQAIAYLSQGQYKYITHQTLYQQVLSLAHAIQRLKIASNKDDESKDITCIGVMSQSRYEWFVLTIASWYLNATIVPLYTTLGSDAIKYILQETEMKIAFVNEASIPIITSIAQKSNSKLKHVISFDDRSGTLENYQLDTYQNLIKIGSNSQEPFPEPKEDNIAVICYTSGTTGIPKGVVTPHKMVCSWVLAFMNSTEHNAAYYNKRYFTFLPMAHAYESNVQILFFLMHCLVGFSSANVKKMMEEMKQFAPEFTSLVPKVLTRIVASIDMKMKELTGMKKSLANRAIKVKLDNLRKNKSVTHFLYDKIIFSKIKNITGGKLQLIHSGSAPLLYDIQEKVSIYLSVDLRQGYGLTETAGAAILAYTSYGGGSSIGVPLASISAKIVSLPDLNYFTTDTNSDGSSCPRGELCVRGESVFPRYFKNKQLTEESIKDGWFHTGDVACINSIGCIQIIDRVKNLIKLQQGEYISPEKLEGIYSKSQLIAQVYIYGESLKSDLVAIISPNMEVVVKWAAKEGIKIECMDEKEMNGKLKMVIATEMKALAKEHELNRWEFPRNIYITKTEFLAENGLLTPTLKLKRKECTAYFKKQIDECYAMGYVFPQEEQ